jgi:hypothetical protein
MREATWEDVSQRMLHYSLHDTRDLRNKYLRITHSSFGVAGKLPRDFMVKALVKDELGDKVVDEYIALSDVWRENERLAVEQWLENLQAEEDERG